MRTANDFESSPSAACIGDPKTTVVWAGRGMFFPFGSTLFVP
jgi:hypothetical protein